MIKQAVKGETAVINDKIKWLWFKKYATKKTVRGELGKPNGFPARRQAQSERKTSLAYFLDYYQ
ncbi:hypothetical protein B0182_07615 [Moraxella bovis]|nr:hypothetical protein DQF64_04815 [Moraxella bovis]OOR89238.1 hypothetical protein B0182_07615 [Moraxella bovis]